MLVGFPPNFVIFVTDTIIIDDYNFVAPLNKHSFELTPTKPIGGGV